MLQRALTVAAGLIVAVTLIGLMVSVVAEVTAWARGTSASNVAIFFEPHELTLSDVTEGVYSPSLKLMNTSDDFVRVVSYRASCTCSKIEFEKDWVPPGESLKIDCDWDLRGKLGQVQAVVALSIERRSGTSGSVHKQSIGLPMRATVQSLWSIEPSLLSFQIDSAGSLDVVLAEGSSASSVEFVAAGGSHPSIRAQVLGTKRVRVNFDPKSYKRNGPISLNVTTNSETVPVKTFPIWIRLPEKQRL